MPYPTQLLPTTVVGNNSSSDTKIPSPGAAARQDAADAVTPWSVLGRLSKPER